MGKKKKLSNVLEDLLYSQEPVWKANYKVTYTYSTYSSFDYSSPMSENIILPSKLTALLGTRYLTVNGILQRMNYLLP